MDNTYNGWTNRETWLVNVWFGCGWLESDDVQSTREFMEEEIDQLESWPWIKDFIDLDAINWDELEEHARELEEST